MNLHFSPLTPIPKPYPMTSMQTQMRFQIRTIRRYILFFVIALIISGITAFPLESELSILFGLRSFLPEIMNAWIMEVLRGLQMVNDQFPFMAYGTDWLAFAHIIIAIGFIGPWLDPVRNKWVIIHAMIACVLIWPLAFIAGSIRGIPFFWQLIDCSFGIIGLIPLALCLREINRLEKIISIKQPGFSGIKL